MKRLVQAAAGLVVGLVIAEGVFHVRDDGAFPHVNIYVPDEALGCRLMPQTQQRIAFGGNPTTTFTTQSLGYRGAEWPDDGTEEVLVVGDSQVFGLGVEDEQTFSHQLGQLTGRSVLNGGVPTYGPDEYLAVAEEVLSSRPSVDTLVLVLNFSNDLFEIDRPNRDRHAVWDGWAVRIETAPASVMPFPGRSWLMRESHLVYAGRRWMYDRTPVPLPSEGDLRDVVSLGDQQVQQRVVLDEGEDDGAVQAQAEAYREAVAEIRTEKDLIEWFYRTESDEDGLALRAAVADAHPGDIVHDGYAEQSRDVRVTAEMLQRGAEIRRTLRARMESFARDRPGAWGADEARELLAAPVALDPQLAGEQVAQPTIETPFAGVVDRALELVARHDATLTVVALPLDVQVSDAEWAKYGAEPVDMTSSRELLSELVDYAVSRGARGVNLLQPLQASPEGAFLQGDLHLSAKGHGLVAGALRDALAEPVPFVVPGPGLPATRSRLPQQVEWEAVGENRVVGSTRNRCQTRAVREWFRMDCRSEEGDEVVGVRLADAPVEALSARTDRVLTVWMPLQPSREVSVDVLWAGRQERLRVTWEGEAPQLAFEPLEDRPEADATTVMASAAQFGGPEPWARYTSVRAQWTGRSIAACAATYPEARERRSCALGSRLHLPRCEEGEVRAGSAGHCFVPCDARRPCAVGQCMPWQGAQVCL